MGPNNANNRTYLNGDGNDFSKCQFPPTGESYVTLSDIVIPLVSNCKKDVEDFVRSLNDKQDINELIIRQIALGMVPTEAEKYLLAKPYLEANDDNLEPKEDINFFNKKDAIILLGKMFEKKYEDLLNKSEQSPSIQNSIARYVNNLNEKIFDISIILEKLEDSELKKKFVDLMDKTNLFKLSETVSYFNNSKQLGDEISKIKVEEVTNVGDYLNNLIILARMSGKSITDFASFKEDQLAEMVSEFDLLRTACPDVKQELNAFIANEEGKPYEALIENLQRKVSNVCGFEPINLKNKNIVNAGVGSALDKDYKYFICQCGLKLPQPQEREYAIKQLIQNLETAKDDSIKDNYENILKDMAHSINMLKSQKFPVIGLFSSLCAINNLLSKDEDATYQNIKGYLNELENTNQCFDKRVESLELGRKYDNPLGEVDMIIELNDGRRIYCEVKISMYGMKKALYQMFKYHTYAIQDNKETASQDDQKTSKTSFKIFVGDNDCHRIFTCEFAKDNENELTVTEYGKKYRITVTRNPNFTDRLSVYRDNPPSRTITVNSNTDPERSNTDPERLVSLFNEIDNP